METVMNALSTTMQSKLYSNYNCLFAAYESQEHCLSELKQENKQLYSERVWLQLQMTQALTNIRNLSLTSIVLSVSVQFMAMNGAVDNQRHNDSSGSSGGENSHDSVTARGSNSTWLTLFFC